MKLQFKHQKFQADAAKAVVDVFAGQPYLTPTYMMDRGTGIFQIGMNEEDDFTGWRNQPLVPELSKRMILEQIQEIQRIYQITPSQKLEGEGYNLTIEMETGVGKTYTYIKTMFELNKHYGWSKFIVVVPSIAIREGVYKSFEVTQEHFAEEYGKKIRFFIYNSAQLTEIDRFASDNSINVMIINSQAFNARGKDARRIYMKLDEFRSRRPIDIIAKTNPVLIIDEPQSVEGKQTKERLREFHPLLTLRYSATHKSDSIYNMIYRLDAMEAYNKRLVKKIAVKGIAESGSTATESYVYLQSINLSKADPTATIQFDYKGTSGIRKVTKTVSIGFNLYDQSNGMEEYHNNFVVKSIDGRDDSVEFLNGIKIYAGDVIGKVSEEQLRRIQIRETILSHIERERQLYYKGIKVLSLFFIDEVAHYKQYDETGESKNGIFADMFEEEYRDIVENLQMGIGEEAYFHYLNSISAESTHAGYFSIDKKGKMVNSKVGRRETTTDDVDAYDLIMKNKELLLDRDPKRSPVRFIFSHSALREGWDNPNVFQICTLKQSGSDVRKRQEVGRGLRLCVNQDGERQDANVLGNDVHNINILTVIASESYDSFAKGLQSEIAEAVGDADDGISIDGKARDLLKAVYLKPLRDAEREMSSGRSSRISQILLNHPVFKDKNEHTVLGIFQDANQKIEEYFTNDPEGKSILQTIRDNLEAFNDKGQKSDAELKTSDIQIKAILESLSLKAPELNPGLGELNLLFIAAELLLLKDDTDGGLKLALIEELEAHLHPQAQLRLISYLQNEYNENDVQIIVSTHSPILASKINLKNLILMKDGKGFDLAEGATGLQKGDYLFLQRFLDSTKANLFFAKGIIMVEGDAENILIPVIADIIGYPLEKYGVSIVNVGSTAFLRYSGILIRKNGEKIGIPVSVITDCDVRPYDIDEKTKEKQFNEKVSESLQAEQAKNEKYSNGSVRGFTSPRWTLEYCIAMSCLSEDFHKAVHYGKKILNAQENIAITDSKIDEANGLVKEEAKQWDSLPLSKRAYNIFSLMLNADGKSGLKAIVAQCLASILRWKVSVIPEKLTQEKMFDVELYGLKTDEKKKVELSNKIENDSFLGYIVRAIKYASGIEE